VKDGLLTVSETSKSLKVSEETVRRYIREKKLKAEKKRMIGLKKVWLVSPEEIRRFQNDWLAHASKIKFRRYNSPLSYLPPESGQNMGRSP